MWQKVLYNIHTIAEVLKAKTVITNSKAIIEHLLTDSRRIAFPDTSLFFALTSSRRDGHQFIEELYKQGVTNFVVTKQIVAGLYPQANFLFVTDALLALQQVAAWHRLHFTYPVIGITGSNGKTIVKEWLYQLLSPGYNIIRSPRSYNSQLGVPLSVWQMTALHTLAIFEAGISKPGEMKALQNIIQPSIGIITNIGEAHSENFVSAEQKAKEKIQLFDKASIVFYNGDDVIIQHEIRLLAKPKLFSWGKGESNHLIISSVNKTSQQTSITAFYKKKAVSITIPFTDEASIEDAIICWCICLHFRLTNKEIQKRFSGLQPVNMRLQLIEAINGCSIINDSYSFDINSFNIALDFLLQQHQYAAKTIILSDFAILVDDKYYRQIVDLLHTKKISRVITVGENWYRLQKLLKNKIKRTSHFITTKSLTDHLNTNHFRNEAILLKGARAVLHLKPSLLSWKKKCTAQ